MKVVQMVTGFDIDYPGGITNYVRNFHKACLSENIESKVVCTFDGRDGEGKPEYNYSVSKIDRFSFFPSKKKSSDLDLINFFEEFRPDVVHFHTIYGLSERVLRYFANHVNIKYVISIHDYFMVCPRIYMIDRDGAACRSIDIEKCNSCISLLDKNDFVRKIQERFKFNLPSIPGSRLDRRMDLIGEFLRGSKKILPVSSRVGEIVGDAVYGLDLQVLNIGNETANKFKLRSPILTNEIEVAFIGTLNRHKGAELFLKFVRENTNSNLKFNFYGRADSEYILELTRLGIKNHGSYRPEQLNNLLDSVDLGFITPIWEDNGPQVVMELINNGIPVLGTSVGGIPDFVKHLETGYLFHPDNNDDVTAAQQWLNTLNKEELNSIAQRLSPLTTVKNHTLSLVNLYVNISGEG